MDDLFTKTANGFTTFLSDLEANCHGTIKTRSGAVYANLSEFIKNCQAYRDEENEITHWIHQTPTGLIVTIFND